jgi:hypothetical protein
MIRIDSQYSEVEKARRKDGAIKFFSNKQKKNREWQVLGALQRQLLASSLDAPVFAVEQESPDFSTYTEDKTFLSFVEVVEVIRPNYRRNHFFKERARPDAPVFFDVDPPLSDLWTPLREGISKKALKGYQRPISLAVYYDIPRSCFPDWSKPFDEYLLDEHKLKPFADLASFDRVFVLYCDQRGLVELHPTPTAIVRDNPFGDSEW